MKLRLIGRWQTIREIIREQGFGFFAWFILALVLGFFIWWVWDQFSDPEQFPAGYLWLADGVIVLNLFLCGWTVLRERFASILLLGATILFEVLIITFMYQI